MGVKLVLVVLLVSLLLVSCRSGKAIAGKADELNVQPGAICGNSILETFENCDDGNTADGDGCSASCLEERGWVCSESGCENARQAFWDDFRGAWSSDDFVTQVEQSLARLLGSYR